MTQSLKALAALMLVAVVTGCGGGGAEQPDPLAAVGNDAQQSVDGLLGYLDRLVAAAGAEAREAIDLAGVLLSTSDDTEPATLK